MDRVSQRMTSVQTPIIPVVGSLIAEHPGTISLGQGVVSYGPPESVASELQRFFADATNHKYQRVDGIPDLKQLIQEKLARENGIELDDPRRIIVTAGGNMGFLNAVMAICDPGDEVILPTPYYFNHEMAIRMVNARPVLVATDETYQLQVNRLRAAITPKTRAIVTVSPNNPSGAVYPETALRSVNEVCHEAGVYHIHDEAYEYFTYEGTRAFSPGSLDSASHGHRARTISLYSLSKAYGFASWRIGYMVVPGDLVDPIKKIQDTNVICPTVISQYAAVAAMRAGQAYCRPHVDQLARVREAVWRELQSLTELALIPKSQGAFYFLLNLHCALDPLELVRRLVDEFQVAAIPGTAFGLEQGCFLRIAYGALAPDTVLEGMGRLVDGLKQVVGECPSKPQP